ncbi:hypothetical protein M3Y98_01151800 [Aphelenchoides besseyi]|nr:hypothetical protein M3Y98_01151800 [Aphelenchoides besseyi]
MKNEKEIGRDRVNSIINNDPFRYERPYYRPSSWYLLLLTIQLTAIIVFQQSIRVSDSRLLRSSSPSNSSSFFHFRVFLFFSYLCTIFALARPCRLLLLPHIFIESLVTLIYFTLSALTIRDALRFSSHLPSSVFRDVEVGRATKFGIILLCGFPFQSFLIVAVIRRYYVGFI